MINETDDAKIGIEQKLHFVQKNLNSPKNRRNSFGNYNYRNCEDIVEAVKKIMPEGCVIGLSDDIVLIGDRYYVKASATFCYGGRAIVVNAFARESLDKKGMDAAQITGSASSYARKYALNGLFAIDDSDDIDSKDNTQEPKKAQQEKPKAAPPIAANAPTGDLALVSKEMVFKLSQLAFNAKLDTKKLYETYKVKGYDQLTVGQAKEIAERCKEIIAAKEDNPLSKAAGKVFDKADYLTV